MAEVYRYNKNLIGCFTGGLHYFGFEDHNLSRIEQEPVLLFDYELKPGDKIAGFDSGNSRTSFLLKVGYMTYIGKIGDQLLFEVYDPSVGATQQNLFQKKPKWLLSFGYISNHGGLFSASGPGTGWDIQPKKIVKHEQ